MSDSFYQKQRNDNNYDNDSNKFIGGAERARRDSRKRLNERGQNNNNHINNNAKKRNKKKQKKGSCGLLALPKSINPTERFFGSLFMSCVSEIAQSNESDVRKVMSDACARVGLPLPEPLPSSYRDAHQFYSMRASLVLEEARCILSNALSKNNRRKPPTDSIRVHLESTEERKKTGNLVLTFEKSDASGSFSLKELYNMRPGGCFLIVPPGCSSNYYGDSSVLGSVVPQFNHDREKQNNAVSLMVFRKGALPNGVEQQDWTIVPLTTLISEMRQFEACTRASQVAFLPTLLAWKESTHTRFDNGSDYEDDDDCQEEEKKDDKEVEVEESVCENISATPMHVPFRLPALNATQERAAKTFLESPPSTLSLVQGPPGTGKTTFMVSVLARCLLRHAGTDEQRRILVTAPTNKAISVLVTRFLDAMGDDTSFNVVMIGVEDKLLGDEEGCASSTQPGGDDPFTLSALSLSLRRIFIYKWLESLARDFQSLQRSLSSRGREACEADLTKARQLTQKLTKSLPGLAKESGAKELALQLVQHLEQESSASSCANSKESKLCLDQLIAKIYTIDQNAATNELLATADVIFCTLSTAGVSAMKWTKRIDDLFVDEAAAATEPEILVPFHLGPTRMLAVGDPMQLPALVVSKQAAEWGLAKSMHERLMLDCGKEHIMLDVQYRMKPDISTFPSKQFYDGKIANGSNVVRSDYKSNATILDGKPYSFIQVTGREQQQSSGSYSNVDEAKATVTLVQMLRKSSLCGKVADSTTQPWHAHDKIRIITFYQGQVALLRRMLNQAGLGQVLVATVDSSQGCEADIVIVSFVRSNHPGSYGNARRSAGFLMDDRRMNVALTRARYQLICIGNARGTLSQSGAATLKAIVDDAEGRNSVSEVELLDPREEPARCPILRNKEDQLRLHKRLAASQIAAVDDKKQSLSMVAALTREINQIKQQRLDALRKVSL